MQTHSPLLTDLAARAGACFGTWEAFQLTRDVGKQGLSLSFPVLTLGMETLCRWNLHCTLRGVLLVMRGKRGKVDYGEEQDCTTDNIMATEPLVFSVLICNYMHLGFKSCHGVTLKKIKWNEIRSSVGSSKFFPISFFTSNSDCIWVSCFHLDTYVIQGSTKLVC